MEDIVAFFKFIGDQGRVSDQNECSTKLDKTQGNILLGYFKWICKNLS